MPDEKRALDQALDALQRYWSLRQTPLQSGQGATNSERKEQSSPEKVSPTTTSRPESK